ncbi:surface-adhesin E family protein [Acinetobacter calcoaceticus]|uniref:surface-adhesin E family protein n=1 Tax=Acinetobacter calcoaceticus TaxID=471 RepID=UPI003A84F9B0
MNKQFILTFLLFFLSLSTEAKIITLSIDTYQDLSKQEQNSIKDNLNKGWISYARDDTRIHYLSYQLIKSISDSVVIAPVKTTPIDLGNLNSLDLWQFDCKNKKMMLLSEATYSITNSEIFSIQEVEFPKEVPAIPNSIANRILEMACVLNYIKNH